MPVTWPESVDPIVDRDHVVMLAYATPARGTVLLPVTNFGIRDREAGTITVNSSVGAWRKLERMRRDPHVALAFHTRRHADHDRDEYLLVQGTANLSEPIPDYPSTVIDHWERVEPWRDLNPLWKRWLRVYALRVAIEVRAERVVVWPGLDCSGTAEVHGPPPPPEPAPQSPPRKGMGPRIDHRRAARRAARLPDVLLGWIGADRFPTVIPVRIDGTADDGILLEAPKGLVPAGGRRAALTAHWFSRNVVGQNQRKHTGWLDTRPDGRLVYSPHTDSSYRFPPSPLLFRLVAGGGTRLWARRAGIDVG
jgi:hypothetical protein